MPAPPQRPPRRDRRRPTLRRPPPRPTKTSTWRFHKDPSLAAKTSKTRPLTNLVNGVAAAADDNFHDSLQITENFADFGHCKPKVKKPTKGARTNWNKFDPSAAHNGGRIRIESTSFLPEENDNNNDEFREFEGEGSESPNLKDQQQSPINSSENGFPKDGMRSANFEIGERKDGKRGRKSMRWSRMGSCREGCGATIAVGEEAAEVVVQTEKKKKE
ncbi:hypothetical protein SASPL_101952 [Salvia splendens]|uniref:Uncharacterized protein n=1 Tax=Salvia splendens TaxID=180675 RepID=A0A8X8YVU6_SALSN|nr:hypothetical protein SASPL_101952 [Salvia splendens]